MKLAAINDVAKGRNLYSETANTGKFHQTFGSLAIFKTKYLGDYNYRIYL